MAVKQSLLESHNNTMKAYDKAGAKSFKPAASPVTVQRKPVSEERSPQISLLQPPLGPQLNEEIECKHECFKRIAAMTQRFPASILKQGCHNLGTRAGHQRQGYS